LYLLIELRNNHLNITEQTHQLSQHHGQ